MSTTAPLESMVSSERLSAIETLGVRLPEEFTAEEAMNHGSLGNWNVRKWPSMAVNPETGKTIARPGMFDVVRDNPFRKGQIDVMGKYPVSESYGIVQNEDHADFLDTLVDESGAHFTLAGSVDGGNKVFLSMRLPGHIQVGGVDQVDLDLLAINSHDGSMSFTLVVLPVRYACRNVLNSRFEGNSGIIRIPHRSGAQRNMVAKARESLDLSFKYLDGFQQDAERLIQTTMTQAKFEAIIEKEFGAAEDAAQAAHTRADKKIETIAELFADAQTNEGIRGTAWAGYNALTEYADHFSPSRGEDRDAARAQRAVLDPAFKNRALDLMLQA